MHSGAKLFYFLAVFALPAFAQSPVPECLRWYAELSPSTEEAVARQQIKTGEFTVTRDFPKYVQHFGDDFARDLRNLGPNGRWLNGGGGKAIAEKEFLAQSQNGKVVSLVYERPAGLSDHKLPRSARFEYKEGRMIEDVPNAELGKFKVISDLYGPLAYTRDFSGVLQKYLDLLEDGGSLYFTLERASSNTQMVAMNGEAASLRDWIESIPGLNLSTWRVGEDETFRIVKNGAVKIPHLETVHYSYSTPPSRLFSADIAGKAAPKAAVPPVTLANPAIQYPPADPEWLGFARFPLPPQQKNKFYQLRTSTERDERLRGAAYEQLVEKLTELRRQGIKYPPDLADFRDRAALSAEEFQELLHSAGMKR